LLESGQYDWLHVAAHGNFYLEYPDGHTPVWLEDGLPLTPDVFVGPRIESHIRRERPAFVLNACHAGRQGWALTGLGGWANRLISLGAGLFIGPQWTVTDGPAKEFARVFYEELLTGQPAAEALRRARLAARREGDPTWLAYSLYAHPNATVRLPGDGDS
jgi:CHAT domain-containing protein